MHSQLALRMIHSFIHSFIHIRLLIRTMTEHIMYNECTQCSANTITRPRYVIAVQIVLQLKRPRIISNRPIGYLSLLMTRAALLVTLTRSILYNTITHKLCWRPPQYAPTPWKLTFDLLTLKVVSESHVTWATSVPVLVFLDLSVLDLSPM